MINHSLLSGRTPWSGAIVCARILASSTGLLSRKARRCRTHL